MVVTNKLYSYSKQLSAPTAYEVIRNQLRELSHEPAHFREHVTIERYIRDKTHLSRSSIMKILAELKRAGISSLRTGGYARLSICLVNTDCVAGGWISSDSFYWYHPGVLCRSLKSCNLRALLKFR
ncbi:helix-turn-helix domain-containing protein [Lelliottia sp.]|uniref:helix-turn-helix domain-containing protein n=1 Tax=Lelliottia sp. TaxID=1898429 RepID=UPI00388F679D